MVSAKELREKMRQDRNAKIAKQMGKGSRAYKRMLERIEAGIKNAAKLGQVSFLFQFNENEADHALIALVMGQLRSDKRSPHLPEVIPTIGSLTEPAHKVKFP